MNTEFKGTHGSWYYDNNGQSKAIFHPTDIGVRLALVDDTFNSEGCNVKANYEWVYNAILISKAPELLEMLSDLVRVYKRDGYLTNAYLEDAEELINKALGND